jgi:2-dehydro-3-deoxyphosphogluconate aldolase / (4S)-4-hydroxy-2-oxoglutarate aldolase
MKRTFSWEKFNAVPIVGILRHYSREQVDRVARQYEESGLSTLEITMNSPGAAATIAGLVKQFGGSLNIGAGTVCTEKDLDKAQAAGAQFIVTPILDKALIKGCRKKKIPIITGAYTPTEIYTAWSLGSSMVKVFPATQLGPAYIKEVLAPLDRLRLLPTGGVNPGNFIDFMRAGAVGAGMGGHLFPRELIDGGRWEELRGHFSAVLKIYLDYRQSLLSANQKPG